MSGTSVRQAPPGMHRLAVAVHTLNFLYSQFVLPYMNQHLPIPEPLWNTVPAEAQAALLAAWKLLEDRISELEATVRDLQARLQLNSTNSSKPPSSDPIGLKRKPPTPPSGRKRGGQPGHRKAFRALVPPEKLRSSRDCKPCACRRCGHALHGEDPNPLIHQVAELPKIEPIVDEYRWHRLSCPDCGETTCGTLPAGVPAASFGPYLQAVLATLAGAYRLSKRQIQQLAGDLFGLSICTGMISKLERQSAGALEAPYNELATTVHTAAVIPRRRDLVASGAGQGLALGDGRWADHGLHDRPQPQCPGGPSGPGDPRGLDRSDRPLGLL